MNTQSLYDRDFYQWAISTAQALKSGHFDQVEIDYLADEVESMAKRDYRELISRLTVLLAHLLKWQFQPLQRCASWTGTIREQRIQIELLLNDSPSLKPKLVKLLEDLKIYTDALKIVLNETGLQMNELPKSLPYTLDQILNEDYLP